MALRVYPAVPLALSRDHLSVMKNKLPRRKQRGIKGFYKEQAISSKLRGINQT
jgi:hypothetical protein